MQPSPQSSLRIFLSPQKDSSGPSAFDLCFHSSPRQPLIFVYINLPVLDISHKWNHTKNSPLDIFFLISYHNTLSFIHVLVGSDYSFLWLSSITLYGYTTFCLSSFECSHFLSIMNNAAMNIHKSLVNIHFHSSRVDT